MRMFSGAGSGLDILLVDPEDYLAISSNFHTCREEARLDSTVTRPCPLVRRATRNQICIMAAPKGPKTFATLEEAKADMKVLIEELLSNKEALLAIAADPENDTQQKKIAKLMPKLVQILGPKLVEKGFCAAPAQASMGACPDAQMIARHPMDGQANVVPFLSHTRTDGVCAWCGRDHDGGDGMPEGSGPGGGWRLRGWRGDQRRCELLLDALYAAPVAGFCVAGEDALD